MFQSTHNTCMQAKKNNHASQIIRNKYLNIQKGHISKNKHAMEIKNMQDEKSKLNGPCWNNHTHRKKKHRKVSSPFSPQSQKRVWVGLGPPQWVDVVWRIHHCTNFQLMRATPIFSAMFRSQKRKFLNHKVCNILRRETTMDLNCLKSFALVQKKMTSSLAT